ncbi:Uncharacterized conserved protein YndB, AHSA1/START domain [Actinopolymorpha cephalotaxi]|uniref:Uncharacterized conserved protein YndB, AHSA1/START domain n=1 Tax=Actinopolymorpha cephalotaxi TaxID=504797 RepID=A0A1I2UR06_9ACTN|nr:SRPBCC domain-containing protein [Actinopolymorpha cephalotaxi]NYH86670.1 uncharacterized protein YndB with AHSA1/START domain [Actinopolymorpha cephalotaxi]SFG78709.1 Uncharacterized conserved protein YndB, AHSA1/START domain [Actinopolymorpha cephalotaxi]
MAARGHVGTEAGTEAGSDVGGDAGRSAERMAAPWPIVHAGATTTATATDGARLEVVRTFPLPSGEVWSAVTEPERLGRWFAEVTGDLRVGGTWTATFDQGAASGVVAECRPESRIVTSWRWHHDPDDNGGAGPSRLTVSLEPVADGTRLALTHEGVTGNTTGQAAGWYAHLAGLAAHLRGPAGEGPDEADWDAEFARALAAVRDPGAAGAGTF